MKLAIPRTDLDRIDGFDVNYGGWGKENSDIMVRLLHAGARRKDGVFATGVHLWHLDAHRAQLSENKRNWARSLLAATRVRDGAFRRFRADHPANNRSPFSCTFSTGP